MMKWPAGPASALLVVGFYMFGCDQDCPTVITPSIQIDVRDSSGNSLEILAEDISGSVDGEALDVEPECDPDMPCSLFFVHGSSGSYEVTVEHCGLSDSRTIEVELDSAQCGPITERMDVTFDLSMCPEG